jgi:hypothetical protein
MVLMHGCNEGGKTHEELTDVIREEERMFIEYFELILNFKRYMIS